jgi:pimeloyl-ACP methyl ester carboxylesterase
MASRLLPFGGGMMSREIPSAGDKVLWIHGYTMDSSLWEPLWTYLPQWYHIGIDLPYHGQSAALPPTYTMPEFARMVGTIALEKGVKHIAGLSLGAILTLQIAIEFPTAFQSVVLGSAGINHGPNDSNAGPHYWRLAMLYRQRGAGPWMTGQWMRWPPNIFKGASFYEALWDDLVEVIDRHRWEEFNNGFMTTLTAHRQIDTLDAIRQIGSPMLLVVGEEEMPAFKQAAAILQETIPTCEVAYLPNAGHLCLLEVPEASARYIAAHWQNAKVTMP